jgi:hypothetical protein
VGFLSGALFAYVVGGERGLALGRAYNTVQCRET